MSIELNFVESGEMVRGEYYFSLLPVTPKKQIGKKVFKIP
jgi:hypothetical protein